MHKNTLSPTLPRHPPNNNNKNKNKKKDYHSFTRSLFSSSGIKKKSYCLRQGQSTFGLMRVVYK